MKLSERFGAQLERAQTLIWAITLLAGLVGAIGVLNSMASNIHERTREIGLLRAVGWTRRQVMQAILVEGCAIAVAGGLLGVAAGVAALHLVEALLGVSPIPLGFEWEVGLLGMALALALGFVGSFLPAWRAARLSPVEALRNG